MVDLLEPIAPEAEPVVVTTVRAVPQVGMIAILAVCLGIILAVDAVVRAFFGNLKGAVGWIPFAGKVITAPISQIEQKVISYLSGLEQDIDSSMGHHVHQLAVLVNRTWHALEFLAANVILLGFLAAGATATYVIGPLRRWIHKQVHRLDTLIHHAVRTVTHITKIVEHTVVRKVVHLTKVITVSVPKYVHRDLLKLNTEVKTINKARIRVDKEIKDLYRHVSTSSIAAVVATVIGTATLDLLKCSELPQAAKGKGCNFWKDLRGLLDIFGTLFLFQHFCDLWAQAEPIFQLFLTPVVGVISSFANGACSQRPSSWETINAPVYPPTASEVTQALIIG